MSKPVAILRRWELLKIRYYSHMAQGPEHTETRLAGYVYGHPRIPDGHSVFTTAIVLDNGLTVETRNTIYVLE